MLNVNTPWNKAAECMSFRDWWHGVFNDDWPTSLDFEATKEWDQQFEWVTGRSCRAGIHSLVKMHRRQDPVW